MAAKSGKAFAEVPREQKEDCGKRPSALKKGELREIGRLGNADERRHRRQKMRGHGGISACVELHREIWGEEDLEVEPSTMFVVAALTGGQVLGAFDGERLVGFTLAVVGLRDGAVYLHSHKTGVRRSIATAASGGC